MALLAFNDWRPVAHVCGSFIGKAAEDEQQELVVVPLVGKVPEDASYWMLNFVHELTC